MHLKKIFENTSNFANSDTSGSSLVFDCGCVAEKIIKNEQLEIFNRVALVFCNHHYIQSQKQSNMKGIDYDTRSSIYG